MSDSAAPFGRIYLIRNEANGKLYVGQTTKPLAERWSTHVMKSKVGSKYPIHRAMRKYGPMAFSIALLEECADEASLNEAEVKWISDLRSTTSEHGYNCTTGGDAGYSLTDEARTNLSEHMKRRLSDEGSRRLKSDLARAQWANPEVRARMQQAAKERSETTLVSFRSASRSYAQSAEGRAQQSEARRKYLQDPVARKHLSEAMKKRWADPIQREKLLAAGQKGRETQKRVRPR